MTTQHDTDHDFGFNDNDAYLKLVPPGKARELSTKLSVKYGDYIYHNFLLCFKYFSEHHDVQSFKTFLSIYYSLSSTHMDKALKLYTATHSPDHEILCTTKAVNTAIFDFDCLMLMLVKHGKHIITLHDMYFNQPFIIQSTRLLTSIFNLIEQTTLDYDQRFNQYEQAMDTQPVTPNVHMAKFAAQRIAYELYEAINLRDLFEQFSFAPNRASVAPRSIEGMFTSETPASETIDPDKLEELRRQIDDEFPLDVIFLTPPRGPEEPSCHDGSCRSVRPTLSELIKAKPP